MCACVCISYMCFCMRFTPDIVPGSPFTVETLAVTTLSATNLASTHSLTAAIEASPIVQEKFRQMWIPACVNKGHNIFLLHD